MHKQVKRFWINEIVMLTLFLIVILDFESVAKLLEPIIGIEKDAVEWAPLYELTYQYLFIVLTSSTLSFLVAFSLGTLVHLFSLDGLSDLFLTIGSFTTTFSTIAVIALLVPTLGYGFYPVIVALVLYGIFPILINTIQGLKQVDPILTLAAEGLGMDRYQKFFKVELPLAMPMIIAGIKTSFIINIAAATVGAVVGAGGLGMPIVSGIRTNDPVLILKGAIPVALIAMLADQLFSRLESGFRRLK